MKKTWKNFLLTVCFISLGLVLVSAVVMTYMGLENELTLALASLEVWQSAMLIILWMIAGALIE